MALLFIAASAALMVVQLVCFALFNKPISPRLSQYKGKIPKTDSADEFIKNVEEQLNYKDA